MYIHIFLFVSMMTIHDDARITNETRDIVCEEGVICVGTIKIFDALRHGTYFLAFAGSSDQAIDML